MHASGRLPDLTASTMTARAQLLEVGQLRRGRAVPASKILVPNPPPIITLYLHRADQARVVRADDVEQLDGVVEVLDLEPDEALLPVPAPALRVAG